MASPHILINVFHPNLAMSRGNRLIVEQLRELSGASIRDVQAGYPDWKLDVAHEQELLLLPPGIAGFRNITDEDISAHGLEVREFLETYQPWAVHRIAGR